jgi:hypothetical protein
VAAIGEPTQERTDEPQAPDGLASDAPDTKAESPGSSSHPADITSAEYSLEREENMHSTKTSRIMALVAGAALLLGAQVMFGAQPAVAIPGLEKVTARSDTNSESPKNVTAFCPDGKRVIGGGGRVFATAAANSTKVMLIRLEPINAVNQSGYVAGGVEVAPGIAGNWWVEAYAHCAPAPAGHEIVRTDTSPSSASTQQTTAECTGDKRVFGTGARIQNSGGQVTLQLTRADGLRVIGRATAKEDADGFTGNWTLTAFAICANERPGFSQEGKISDTTPADVKAVTHTCPDGTFVHNVAVASSGTPPGLATTPPGVALQTVFPADNLRTAQIRMVETTPTSVPWDAGVFMICGP